MMKIFDNMKFSGLLRILVIVSVVVIAGCAKQEIAGNLDQDYGYVQFKLYKEASYVGTKAVVSQLEYLNDASKIMVMLEYGNNELTQTLTLSSHDAASAEFGLRSEKLQLVAGEYTVKAFTLYDKLDEELYRGGESGSFTVLPGGLVMHDVLADVVERGKVRFTLVKDFKAAVKAAVREYTFDEIRYVDLTVKDVKANGTVLAHLPILRVAEARVFSRQAIAPSAARKIDAFRAVRKRAEKRGEPLFDVKGVKIQRLHLCRLRLALGGSRNGDRRDKKNGEEEKAQKLGFHIGCPFKGHCVGTPTYVSL